MKIRLLISHNIRIRLSVRYQWYGLCLMVFFCCFQVNQSNAQRWSSHHSEAEVYEVIHNLLVEAELPLSKIRRGSYPLFLANEVIKTIPLLSAPCPLLNDCETLLKSLRSRILRRGYHLVYSDQEARENGPLHFAIAKGDSPVMALRLFPASSSATILYHIHSDTTIRQSELNELNSHLTFLIDESISLGAPELIDWLDQSSREYVIKLDVLNIKRSLIHSSTGEILTEFQQRRSAIREQLARLVRHAPNSLGFYIDQDVNSALDRAGIDELISFCSAHNRLIILGQLNDDIAKAVARASGVRVLEMTDRLANRKFDERLKALETRLVIDGEIASEIDIRLEDDRRILKIWLRDLIKRDVVILRLSESAW